MCKFVMSIKNVQPMPNSQNPCSFKYLFRQLYSEHPVATSQEKILKQNEKKSDRNRKKLNIEQQKC